MIEYKWCKEIELTNISPLVTQRQERQCGKETIRDFEGKGDLDKRCA